MRNMWSLITVQRTSAAQMKRTMIRFRLIVLVRSISTPTPKIEASIIRLQIVVRGNTTILTKLVLN